MSSGDVSLIMVSAHNRLELASKVLESAADLEHILSSNTGSNLANISEVIQLSATYLMYRITLVCLKSSKVWQSLTNEGMETGSSWPSQLLLPTIERWESSEPGYNHWITCWSTTRDGKKYVREETKRWCKDMAEPRSWSTWKYRSWSYEPRFRRTSTLFDAYLWYVMEPYESCILMTLFASQGPSYTRRSWCQCNSRRDICRTRRGLWRKVVCSIAEPWNPWSRKGSWWSEVLCWFEIWQHCSRLCWYEQGLMKIARSIHLTDTNIQM